MNKGVLKDYIQFGYSRTGSTVVWNIADEILSYHDQAKKETKLNVDKFLEPDLILKSHKIDEFNQYLQNGKVALISIRHPLECIKSKMRVKSNLAVADDQLFIENRKQAVIWLKEFYYTNKKKKKKAVNDDIREKLIFIDYSIIDKQKIE